MDTLNDTLAHMDVVLRCARVPSCCARVQGAAGTVGVRAAGTA